jgi:lysophospholipase L1-like esterase
MDNLKQKTMYKLFLFLSFFFFIGSINAQTAPIKKKAYVDEQKILNVEAATPRAGYISAPYRKADGNWYEKTDAGVEQIIIDTVAMLATKYDLQNVNVDTVAEIATKYDLTQISTGSVDTINEIATKYDLTQIEGLESLLFPTFNYTKKEGLPVLVTILDSVLNVDVITQYTLKITAGTQSVFGDNFPCAIYDGEKYNSNIVDYISNDTAFLIYPVGKNFTGGQLKTMHDIPGGFHLTDFGYFGLADNVFDFMKEKNKSFSALSKVVFYGDSWTKKTDSSPRAFSERFEDRYEVDFGGDTLNIINNGKSGQTSEWGRFWFDSLVINESPNFVIINFSINDARSLIDTSIAVQFNISIDSPYANTGNTISGVTDINRWYENIIYMINTAKANNITPIILLPSFTDNPILNEFLINQYAAKFQNTNSYFLKKYEITSTGEPLGITSNVSQTEKVTINIPVASAAKNGLLSNTTQTIAGSKVFTSTLSAPYISTQLVFYNGGSGYGKMAFSTNGTRFTKNINDLNTAFIFESLQGGGLLADFRDNNSSLFSIDNLGQIKLSEYGSGTITGTAAKYLAVELDGDVIEVDAPTGGSVDTLNEIATKYDLTGITSDNIYSADGTLTGDRTVTMGGNYLNFEGQTQTDRLLIRDTTQTTGRIFRSFTDTISNFIRPVIEAVNWRVNPSSPITNFTDFHALDFNFITDGINITNKTRLYGIESTIRHSTINTLDGAYPFFSNIQNLTSGTITSAVGIRVNAANLSTGTITNVSNLVLEGASTGSGTVENITGLTIYPLTGSGSNYGIKINEVSGGASNNYGIFSDADENYFHGLEAGNSGSLVVPSSASEDIQMKTAGTSKINILGGNPIISTASKPKGGINFGSTDFPTSLFINTTPVNGGFSSGLGIEGTYSSLISKIKIQANGARSAGQSGTLSFETSQGTTLSEKMSIDGAGSLKLNNYTTDAKTGTATNYLATDAVGNVIQTIIPNVLTGTGTTNYLPKFTSSSSIGNSLLFDDGAKMGISTITPADKLHINGGNLRVQNSAPRLYLLDDSGATTHNLTEWSTAAGNMTFQTRTSVGGFVSTDYQMLKNASGATTQRWFIGSSEIFRIHSNSNFAIGNINPSQKLHVTGNARITGAIYDSNNEAGTANQILSSTVTGTDWIDAQDPAAGMDAVVANRSYVDNTAALIDLSSGQVYYNTTSNAFVVLP